MNDGMRVVIERRGKDPYWTMTQYGQQHTGQVGGLSFETTGHAIDQYLRALDSKRDFDKERDVHFRTITDIAGFWRETVCPL